MTICGWWWGLRGGGRVLLDQKGSLKALLALHGADSRGVANGAHSQRQEGGEENLPGLGRGLAQQQQTYVEEGGEGLDMTAELQKQDGMEDLPLVIQSVGSKQHQQDKERGSQGIERAIELQLPLDLDIIPRNSNPVSWLAVACLVGAASAAAPAEGDHGVGLDGVGLAAVATAAEGDHRLGLDEVGLAAAAQMGGMEVVVSMMPVLLLPRPAGEELQQLAARAAVAGLAQGETYHQVLLPFMKDMLFVFSSCSSLGGVGALEGLGEGAVEGLEGGAVEGLGGGAVEGLGGGAMEGLGGGAEEGLGGGAAEGLGGGTVEGLGGGAVEGLEGGAVEGLGGGAVEGLEGGAMDGLGGGAVDGLGGPSAGHPTAKLILCQVVESLSEYCARNGLRECLMLLQEACGVLARGGWGQGVVEVRDGLGPVGLTHQQQQHKLPQGSEAGGGSGFVGSVHEEQQQQQQLGLQEVAQQPEKLTPRQVLMQQQQVEVVAGQGPCDDGVLSMVHQQQREEEKQQLRVVAGQGSSSTSGEDTLSKIDQQKQQEGEVAVPEPEGEVGREELQEDQLQGTQEQPVSAAAPVRAWLRMFCLGYMG
jgi:hypothetical protein